MRGVDLIGTPLIAFSKITAADDEVGVFNGICGAESGWVPVSAISPGSAGFADRSAAQRKIAGESAGVALSSSRQINGVEMKTTAKIVIGLLAILLPVCAQEKEDVVMKAMNDELSRTVNQLHVTDLEKPYFLSYRVDDLNSATVSATLGSITQSNPVRTRIIGVEVRVGDYTFDNTNYVSAQSFGGGGMPQASCKGR